MESNHAQTSAYSSGSSTGRISPAPQQKSGLQAIREQYDNQLNTLSDMAAKLEQLGDRLFGEQAPQSSKNMPPAGLAGSVGELTYLNSRLTVIVDRVIQATARLDNNL